MAFYKKDARTYTGPKTFRPSAPDRASKSRKLAILFVIICFPEILLAGAVNYAPAEIGGLNLRALYGQWVIEQLSSPRITLVETFRINREFNCEIQLYYSGLKARRRFRGTWNAHSSDLVIDPISLPDALSRRISRLLIMHNVNIDGSCMRFQDHEGRLRMATKISDRVTNH